MGWALRLLAGSLVYLTPFAVNSLLVHSAPRLDADFEKKCGTIFCAWTAQWSCPGQPLGSSGYARADGSMQYYCCCTKMKWMQDERLNGGTASPSADSSQRPSTINDIIKEMREIPGDFADWQSWSELIFLRDRKFVFCALPKSACTSWKQLLLRVMGAPHWKTHDSRLIHDPTQAGLPLVGVKPGGYTRDAAFHNVSAIKELMDFSSNGKVMRAVIVRDPITRLLSAFLDRCVDMEEWHRCFAPGPITFEQFVTNLEEHTNQGRISLKDVHIRQQTDMCGIRYMDYDLVGHMENYADDSRTIMQRAGLWEDFGRTGWGPDGSQAFGETPEFTSNHKNSHGTDAQVCEHYTPLLMLRVHQLYKRDFEAFTYSIDPWLSACAPVWQTPHKA